MNFYILIVKDNDTGKYYEVYRASAISRVTKIA